MVKLSLDRSHRLAIEIFKSSHLLNPEYLSNLFKMNICKLNTRQRSNLDLVIPRVNTTNYGLHSIKYTAAVLWNDLPKDYKVLKHYLLLKILSQHGRVLVVNMPNVKTLIVTYM